MNLLLLVFDLFHIHHLLHFIINVLKLQLKPQLELFFWVNVDRIFPAIGIFVILLTLMSLVEILVGFVQFARLDQLAAKIHLDHIYLRETLNHVPEDELAEPVVRRYVELLKELVLQLLVSSVHCLVPTEGLSQLHHESSKVSDLDVARSIIVIARPAFPEVLQILLLDNA